MVSIQLSELRRGLSSVLRAASESEPDTSTAIMKTAQAIADKEGVTTSIQVPGQDGVVIAKPSKSSRKRAHS